jgi:hypothetical protein
VTRWRTLDDPAWLAIALTTLAGAHALSGELHAAAAPFAEGEALAGSAGDDAAELAAAERWELWPSDQLAYAGAVSQARAQSESRAFEDAWQEAVSCRFPRFAPLLPRWRNLAVGVDIQVDVRPLIGCAAGPRAPKGDGNNLRQGREVRCELLCPALGGRLGNSHISMPLPHAPDRWSGWPKSSLSVGLSAAAAPARSSRARRAAPGGRCAEASPRLATRQQPRPVGAR